MSPCYISLPQTIASEFDADPKGNSQAIMSPAKAVRKGECQPGSLPDSAGHRRRDTQRAHVQGWSHSPQDVCLSE